MWLTAGTIHAKQHVRAKYPLLYRQIPESCWAACLASVPGWARSVKITDTPCATQAGKPSWKGKGGYKALKIWVCNEKDLPRMHSCARQRLGDGPNKCLGSGSLREEGRTILQKRVIGDVSARG